MRRARWNCVRAAAFGAVILAAAGVAVAGDAKNGDEAKGFVPIFDGKTMEGWDVFRGTPEHQPVETDGFAVEDGTLHCKGLKDYWLRYKAEKLDSFVLRFEYKLTKACNSGVCIHTQDKGIPWQTGFEVQILDDYGKDPDLHTDGSVYDVITPMYNETKPTGEWNEMEITCCGKLVKVAVNGLKLIDYDFGQLTMLLGKFKTPYANLPSTGYLTFQDHGMGWWMRNVRLKKLDAAECAKKAAKPKASGEGFKTIFDGKSLDGWSVYNPEAGMIPTDDWVLTDGAIHCNGKGPGTYFRYEKPLADVVVKGEFRVAPKTNSGIILRSKKTGEPCFSGFEVQVFDDYGRKPYRHCCGGVYDIATPMFNTCKPAGEWNQFEITTDGPLVSVVLNGWKIIDTDFSKLSKPRGKFDFAYADMPKAGYLCFQDHGGAVDYRNIQAKKIRH